MAPLIAFSVFDPLFVASVSIIQAWTVNACSVIIWIFFISFWRLGSSQSSRSEDDDSDALFFLSPRVYHHWTETYASQRPESFFYCKSYFGKFPLISSLFPLEVFLQFVFVMRAVKIAADPLWEYCMFCWLFLFPANDISNRTNVWGQNNSKGVLWSRRSDCWLWICAASGRRLFWNVGAWHRAFKQTLRDGVLRFFQEV